MSLIKSLNCIILLSTASMSSFAQNCPTPPTAIDISMNASVEFDKKNQDYIYTYKVINGPKAKLEAFMIHIEAPGNIYTISSPDHWKVRFDSDRGGYPDRIHLFSARNSIPRQQRALHIQIQIQAQTGNNQVLR